MKKIIEKINNLTNHNLGLLIILIVILYLITIVGKTIWDNYQSNKGIAEQERDLEDLQFELEYLESEIVYYQSQSFKEKQARAKLGYILPGESVVSVPKDNLDQEVPEGDSEQEGLIQSDTPNYVLWQKYFFE